MKLNDKRKKIETLIINEIDFKKIENENKKVIIYFNPNMNEGLIGIIAARLKDHFNKPAIVITSSNHLLKGSARSVYNYNIGHAIKNLIEKKIIVSGGGHNMAAGFTLEKDKLKRFEDSILKDFLKKALIENNNFTYDAEVSSLAFNKFFYEDIKKLEPFGVGNPVPTFLIKDLKIIKISSKKYRVLIGPFNDIKSLQESFDKMNLLNFENLEIIKNV